VAYEIGSMMTPNDVAAAVPMQMHGTSISRHERSTNDSTQSAIGIATMSIFSRSCCTPSSASLVNIPSPVCVAFSARLGSASRAFELMFHIPQLGNQ
jgi:hypothetical protein